MTSDMPAVSAVRRAVIALDPYALVELVNTIRGQWAPTEDHGFVHFTCPLCTGGKGQHTASLDTDDHRRSHNVWTCRSCGHRGTRHELERLVLEHPDSLAALRDHLVPPEPS